MTERDLIRFDRIIEVNRDDQRVAVYFDVSELSALVDSARAGIALAGIADPAAFVAKVREIVNYQQSDIHDRIDELAKLMPPETP